MPDLRSPLTRLVLALLVGVSAVLIALGYQKRADRQQLVRLETALQVTPLQVPAPSVDLVTREGSPVPLASYRGRLVFVNFWATWCGPCIAEMPSMVALHDQLDPTDIVFVSIAEDDTWPPLDSYLARNPLPFDVYRDRPPRVENDFATTRYPTSFLIDRDGTALYRFNGARDWDTPDTLAFFELLGASRR